MAEIALLVAEEFEARRRLTHEDGLQAIHAMAFSYLKQAERKAEHGLAAFKETDAVVRVTQQLREHLHKPETAVSHAAVDGIFSA